MDIDRYIAENTPVWDRLDELSRRAAARVSRLSAAEVDELVARYQQASAHLAYARTHFDDAALVGRLSLTVGSARGAIYRRKQRPGVAAARFFSVTLPAAAWNLRRPIGVAALLMYGSALAVGLWLSNDEQALNATVTPEQQQLIADSQFEEYYKSDAAEVFSAKVTTNNIRVSFVAFAGGILLVPTAIMLLTNGLNVGAMAAVMHKHDAAAAFWGLITPHGLIETTAICLVAGAGLRLGWTFLIPGDRSRADALAEEGLRSVAVAMGCTVLFVAAGITEAFVTPSAMPTAMRVGIGIVLELAALTWLFGMGANAAAAGYSGRLGESADTVTPQRRPVDFASR